MDNLKFAFISHRNIQPDSEITLKMHEYLANQKLETWYDTGLRAGDYAGQLSRKLLDASAYILVASKDSLVSKEVTDEIGIMRRQCQISDKVLIPFIIDDYFFNMEASAAHYFLGSNRNQAIILSKFPSLDAAFERLADYLKDYLDCYVNNPDDFTCDDTRTILKKYEGTDSIVSVPYGVVEISDNAFMSNTTLEKVKIPKSVKAIGKRAFFGCSNLMSVEGMEGLEHCDITAFDNTGVYIGEENNFMLGGVVFGGKPSADGVLTLPQGARVVATRAFACSSASEIVFPNGIEHIGVRSFVDCCEIKELQFPQSLKTIATNAFRGCTSLESVVFEGKIPDNSKEAFDDNVNIRRVDK